MISVDETRLNLDTQKTTIDKEIEECIQMSNDIDDEFIRRNDTRTFKEIYDLE